MNIVKLLIAAVFAICIALSAAIICAVYPIVMDRLFPPEWKVQFERGKQMQDWKAGAVVMKDAIKKACADSSVSCQWRASLRQQLGEYLINHSAWDDAKSTFGEMAKYAIDGNYYGDLMWADDWLCRLEDSHHSADGKYVPDVNQADKYLAACKPDDDFNRKCALLWRGVLKVESDDLQTSDGDFSEALVLVKKLKLSPSPNYVWRIYGLMVNGHLAEAAEQVRSAPENLRHDLAAKYGQYLRGYEFNRKSKLSIDVQKLLKAEQFGELEKTASKLILDKSRTAKGYWDLDRFFDQCELARDATDKQWEANLQLMKKWRRKYPASSVAAVACGNSYVSYAWKARGGGYADSVSNKGWKLMGERLVQARAELESVPDGGLCPSWYRAMQSVVLGQDSGKTAENRLVEAGMKRWPTYDPTAFAHMWFLQPRWYGDDDEWVTWMTGAANKKSGEAGDIFYARSVWYLDWAYDNIFDEFKSLSYPRFLKGMKLICKQYPESLEARAVLFKIAALQKDDATAHGAFEGFKETALSGQTAK